MSSQVEHTDVGAYALGLLEEPDRRAFEAHLGGCASCTAELAELSGTADTLIGSIGALDPPVERIEDPPPPEVIDLLRRGKRAERRRRFGTYAISGVAAAALLATGITLGNALNGEDGKDGQPGGHQHGPAQALVIWGERHSGSDAGTGASGVVGLETKGWGTHVGLELTNVRGPLKCRLEAVSRTGERTVVTAWAVPPKGYGVPGSTAPLITHGGTPIPRAELARFEVKIENGGTLLTIPL